MIPVGANVGTRDPCSFSFNTDNFSARMIQPLEKMNVLLKSFFNPSIVAVSVILAAFIERGMTLLEGISTIHPVPQNAK